MNGIDQHIASCPKETQIKLKQIRAIIKKAAPDAEEAISYGIPTFKLNGNLVHFAGYAHHIGFYPGAAGIAEFADQISKYKFAKGSVQFPLEKPLPVALINKIVKFRIKQNLEKKGAKKKSISKSTDKNAVSAFIQKLEPELAKLVEAIRKLILSTDKQISEEVKWNSPSFYFNGEMKKFDAKEYKRDLVVIHTRKSNALLIFPTGASIKDGNEILEGDYKDGRRMVTINTLSELRSKQKALRSVIKSWLDQIEK